MPKITFKFQSVTVLTMTLLKKNTFYGRAEYINTIIPLPVKFNPNDISVSSIHAKEENKCNPLKHGSEK